jgi:Na+/H+ antiporter NhaC
MEKNDYPIKLYGGNTSAWLCIVFAVVGIFYMMLVKGGSSKSLQVVLFLSLVFGLVLAKDRQAYGDEILKGLRGSMVTTICVAFFFAGLLSALLKASGLIQALIWLLSVLNVNVGFLPVAAFLVCVLISTACGTSTGTVTAVAPVVLPLAHQLGIDLGLMCGAIISGAIFGDNVAPISDTTIASSQTQGASLRDVVRTRIPYAAIAAVASATLYIVLGLNASGGSHAVIKADPAYAKSLIFLVLPFVLVFLMRKGWGLVSSLLLSNALAVVFSLGLGIISAAKMFSDKSPIASGMGGMANIAIVSFLIVMLIQIPSKSGALDDFAVKITAKCKTIRGAELVTYFLSIIGVIATHSSPNTIMFFGPFVRKLMSSFQKDADYCRSANILDGVGTAVNGLIPYGNPVLVAMGVASTVLGSGASFSYLNIVGYIFHCWGLLIVFLISILTGIGRNRDRSKDDPIVDVE